MTTDVEFKQGLELLISEDSLKLLGFVQIKRSYHTDTPIWELRIGENGYCTTAWHQGTAWQPIRINDTNHLGIRTVPELLVNLVEAAYEDGCQACQKDIKKALGVQ